MKTQLSVAYYHTHIAVKNGSETVASLDVHDVKLAHLFAAAPDLLEALEACARELAAHQAVTTVIREGSGLPDMPCPVLAQATAAIAKATGRS